MNLTDSIAEKIVRDILEGKYSPGDKLPSERDMAIRSSISRVTARRAYEQLLKAKIIVRQAGCNGTKVAKGFSGNTDDIKEIAIITTLRDPFSIEFIESAEKICGDNDILTIISVAKEGTSEQTEKALKLTAKGIKNIIIWGFDKRVDFRVFERIRVLGINMVFFDRVIPGQFADFVGLDNAHGISVIFKKALSDGCKNFIFADISDLQVDSNIERKKTFVELCKKHNFDYSVISVPWRPKNKEEIKKISDKFFANYPYRENTALICVNDTIAISLFDFKPQYAKIYGIDGTKEAVGLGITTYLQPISKMAEASIVALQNQKRLGSKWNARQYRLKGELISE